VSNEGNGNKEYRAYLVRLWPVRSGGQRVWRASVEDAHSGERRAFADLAHLFAFLQEAALDNPSKFQDKEQLDD
jgi:hypothetical protein